MFIKFNVFGQKMSVKRKDGEFEFRPPSSFVLEAGMTLIVMGDIDNIYRAREML